MKLKPLYDRVVIKPIEPKKVSSSGIILPSMEQEKPCMGKVICVGDGQTFEGNKVDMQVKEDDIVLYSKFAGASFTFKEDTYLIIRQADILSIVEGEV